MHDIASEDEERVPEQIENSVWDIPLGEGDGGDENAINEKNSSLLKRLVSDFPCLTITLRYKKFVKRGARDADDGLPEFFVQELYWPVREEVSLHKVAIGVLTDMFRAKKHSFGIGVVWSGIARGARVRYRASWYHREELKFNVERYGTGGAGGCQVPDATKRR